MSSGLKSGDILFTDLELKKAMLYLTPVMVWWREGEIANHGGLIETVTPEAVQICGMYFMRSACTFEVV